MKSPLVNLCSLHSNSYENWRNQILQVGKFLQLIATFIGGFVVAFVKGWLLSLVMLACIPPVVFAAGAVAKVLSTISSKGQESYGDAGNVVEQTIGAIKTVSQFTHQYK
jgi:ATP-binding cassette subfamily B (MDR/TAP) protein 1